MDDICSSTLKIGMTRTPMVAQIRADRPTVNAMFMGTLMPIRDAAVLFSDTQRMALPILVVLKKI